jgi:hypothetical protein
MAEKRTEELGNEVSGDGTLDERGNFGRDGTLASVVEVGGSEVGGEEDLVVQSQEEGGKEEGQSAFIPSRRDGRSGSSAERTMVFLKSTILPFPSVSRPSSRTWRKTVVNSLAAFSISSTRMTVYGFRLDNQSRTSSMEFSMSGRMGRRNVMEGKKEEGLTERFQSTGLLDHARRNQEGHRRVERRCVSRCTRRRRFGQGRLES